MNGVSIVIPAHNAERTLRECLQATTTLKWPGELEVIVVNDGSSDKTSEIASSFSKVKVIDVPHEGVAQATNIGIKAAHYDIRTELAQRFRRPHDQVTSLWMILQVPLTMLVLLFATFGSGISLGAVSPFLAARHSPARNCYSSVQEERHMHPPLTTTFHNEEPLLGLGSYKLGDKTCYPAPCFSSETRSLTWRAFSGGQSCYHKSKMTL